MLCGCVTASILSRKCMKSTDIIALFALYRTTAVKFKFDAIFWQ